ncbi:MAG: gluconate 2-dehydrogenase subunit 3 family protein [Gammaproteobacteria bacterium]|nr:gluconate 2-dehydrogenase subunit 3 family protein [Gammaproteobacteria bacterium]
MSAPFFAKLRELTVVGYFSSELGATEFLEYNPMPMRYDGDFDFEVGTHWITERRQGVQCGATSRGAKGLTRENDKRIGE